MRNAWEIGLNLNANVVRYRVTVFCEGMRLCERVLSGSTSLCVMAPSPLLTLAASPLTEGFSGRRFVTIDADRRCPSDLFFRFSERLHPSPRVYAFRLTDRIYGLPVSGTLQFFATVP